MMRGTRPETEDEKRAFVENMQYRKQWLVQHLKDTARYYDIPLRKGAPILYGGKPATVKKSAGHSHYIYIQHEDGTVDGPHHPTWNIVYLEQAT